MTWQGHLRALAHKYDKIIVCGPNGHRPMYEFCHEYIPYDSSTVKANMWMNDGHLDRATEYFRSIAFGPHEFGENNEVDWLSPTDVWHPFIDYPKWEKLIAIQPQVYIRFGRLDPTARVHIVYHARKRDDWDSSFRNWDGKHCAELLQMFPRKWNKCAIGTKEHAIHIPGTIDCRGMRMEPLFRLLHNSQVLVGPISGPIHLGALCGIPTVSWATKQEHKERIETKWNPLQTPVRAICADDEVWKKRIPWHPPADDLYRLIQEFVHE